MPTSVSVAFHSLMNAFIFTLSGSYARTYPEALALFQLFATIELTMAAIAWGLWRQSWIAGIAFKILGFGVLLWILDNWTSLSNALRNGFIEAGLLIGGSVLTVTDITDPGNIVDFGMSVTAVFVKTLGTLSIINYGFIIIIGGAVCLLIIAFYAVVAAHVFKALLEFYIITACLILLVPFLAHEKTAPFGERVFGTFIAHALRLLIYAALLSIALPVMYTYQLGPEPSFGDVVILGACALLFFVLGMSLPQIALGMISGAPVLSFSNFALGAQSAAQMAASVGAAGAAVSVAGAGAIRHAVTGASAYVSAAQMGAAQYGSAHPDSSAVAQGLLGGASGVGQYMQHQVTSGFRDLIQSGRVAAARAFPTDTP
jgi:type IV secretion system protein TrbL